MLHALKPATWMIIVLICFTGVAGIAWQNNPVANNPKKTGRDTIPKKEKKEKVEAEETVINGDLDKAIEEVNRARENLNRQLQHKDWGNMQKNLQQSLEKLNAENIHAQIENALKNIDLQKIQLQAQAALKQVDWEKMQKDLQKAQAELKNNIDAGKMQMEIQNALEETKKAMAELKATDMEKIQQELEETQEELKNNQYKMQEDMERAKKEIKEAMNKDFRQELEKAKEEVKKAAAELQQYKEMLNEMGRDGLLKTGEPYSIEYKKDELFINGVKQPDTVTGKYKHYFKKENVKIKRRKGEEDEDERTIHL